MSNFIVATVSTSVTPLFADTNANRIIQNMIDALNDLAGQDSTDASEQDSTEQVTPEPVSIEDRQRDLFTRVATGDLSMDEAVVALKALTDEANAALAAAAKKAKQPTPVLLIDGQPATAADVKRRFRGCESGHSVSVSSLDGSVHGALTLYRFGPSK